MSETNRRPEPRGNIRRPKRQALLENVQLLEERKLLAPVIATATSAATLTNTVITDNGDNTTTISGTITVTRTPSTISAAPLTSVAQLTSANSFGGDIVRIQAGPGGDFGKGVYAISRGGGDNNTNRSFGIVQPINRPGVIYRVDPATGKSSVFFDLNTVINQIEPQGNAANGGSAGSGLLNWYDLAFDPEGIFDGKPSLFVSSLSQTDPNKNVVYRIGPDGSFLGLYIRFTAGATAGEFIRQPSAVLVPPVEQQTTLKGLFVGVEPGVQAADFQALFFDANAFRPGGDVRGTQIPAGVSGTGMTLSPQVALTEANTSYASQIYSVFSDFGTPAGGGIPSVPGLSGVQGLGGELLINPNNTTIVGANSVAGTTPPLFFSTDPLSATPDLVSAIATPFRRFQDASFDQFGYFSYSLSNAATVPTYQGSLFVSDLAGGLTVPLPSQGGGPTINIPVQGPGAITVIVTPGANGAPDTINSVTQFGTANLGGRIVRINPAGVVTSFAEGFNTSGAQDATSFVQSSLSVTFSADGTTFYASDDEGIWQFKTVTSLASATSGSIIGLNDLRTLGVPYDGQDSAVAIVDTGVDSLTPNFRGRVANGFNVLNNSLGNDDTAAAGNGHGTIIAGVIAQFVPQATLNPVNVFTANQVVTGPGLPSVANATTPQNVYLGLDFVAKNPFVRDPIRPNKVDRTVASVIGFGTQQTYNTETGAFKTFPQVTAAFKNQFKKFRNLGITPIASAGQYGNQQGASVGATVGDVQGMAFPAVLNEVVSVTGSYPFPYSGNARSTPNDPGLGIVPRPSGPLSLFGVGGNTIGATLNATAGSAAVVAANDAVIFKDKLLVASNRSLTTDYTAPALDIPSWSRTVSGTIGGTVAGSVGGTGGNATFGFNNFQEGGTSLSSAVVTGSFAMVASALDFWGDIAATNGVTVNGYLTTPVGARQLNFGKGGVIDLSAYANPDSINSILQWTAVPATDAPNTLDTVDPPTLMRNNENYRSYARIDIGNAIAAIEGSIALNYLFQHGSFDLIDANKNGLITAQEIQNFVDNSSNIGLPEAGAMARLLGGTARTPTVGAQSTTAGETPDQPDVLSRRFNFFEYAADGEQNGAVTIDQLRLLAKNLLPAPDAFVVVDRQRASINGFLLDPRPLRNISDLRFVKPTYAFIPKSQVARYKNISPAKFGVGKGQLPVTQTPIFTLFANGKPQNISKKALNKASRTKATSETSDTSSTPLATTKPTVTKPTATTTTASTTTTGGSSSTTSGTAYLAAINSALQGKTPTTTTSNTTLSQATKIGAPAGSTSSGSGTSTQAAETMVAAAATTPATTTKSEAETTAKADSKVAKAKSEKTKKTLTPEAKARLAKAKAAEDDKFDFWNPWKSIKKAFND